MVRFLLFSSLICLVGLLSSCDPPALNGEIRRTTICKNPRLDVVITDSGVHLQEEYVESKGYDPVTKAPSKLPISIKMSGATRISDNKDAPFFFDEKNMILYVFESEDVIQMVKLEPPGAGETYGVTRLFVFEEKHERGSVSGH